MSSDLAERSTVQIAIPPGAKLLLGRHRLTAEGPLGKIIRPFPDEVLELKVTGAEAVLRLRQPSARKQSRSLLNTWQAHVRNLVGGVTLGVEAKLKVVAAHFPMKVQVKDSTLLIENFLGEKYPRQAELVPGVSATVEGEFVTLRGPDVELVGQSAANIERATHIREYDPRVFQDGIFLVERAHLREAGA